MCPRVRRPRSPWTACPRHVWLHIHQGCDQHVIKALAAAAPRLPWACAPCACWSCGSCIACTASGPTHAVHNAHHDGPTHARDAGDPQSQRNVRTRSMAQQTLNSQLQHMHAWPHALSLGPCVRSPRVRRAAVGRGECASQWAWQCSLVAPLGLRRSSHFARARFSACCTARLHSTNACEHAQRRSIWSIPQ